MYASKFNRLHFWVKYPLYFHRGCNILCNSVKNTSNNENCEKGVSMTYLSYIHIFCNVNTTRLLMWNVCCRLHRYPLRNSREGNHSLQNLLLSTLHHSLYWMFCNPHETHSQSHNFHSLRCRREILNIYSNILNILRIHYLAWFKCVVL